MTWPTLPAASALRTRRWLQVSHGRGGQAALAIYRPLTCRGWLLRTAASVTATLPVRPALTESLIGRLAELLELRVDGAAVMASSTPGRRIVGLASGRRLVAVAKVGLPDDWALRHEAHVLVSPPSLPALQVPRLISAGPLDDAFVCVTEAVHGRGGGDRVTAWRAAVALARAGWTHGDLTPWNLIRTPATLLDWEFARAEFVPLFDLAHYVIRREAYLGGASAPAVVRQLCGAGGAGARYLAELGLPLRRAPSLVHGYIDQASSVLSSPTEIALREAVRSRLG